MKSDSELQHDIQEELDNETDVNVEQVDVQVYKGAITLTGNVATEREKWKADDPQRSICYSRCIRTVPAAHRTCRRPPSPRRFQV